MDFFSYICDEIRTNVSSHVRPPLLYVPQAFVVLVEVVVPMDHCKFLLFSSLFIAWLLVCVKNGFCWLRFRDDCSNDSNNNNNNIIIINFLFIVWLSVSVKTGFC